MVLDYQKLILQFADDGKEHSLSEAENAIAQHLALSEEDRKESLPVVPRESFITASVGRAGSL
jgi:hypothetical protein